MELRILKTLSVVVKGLLRPFISNNSMKRFPLRYIKLAPLFLLSLGLVWGCDSGNRLPSVPPRVTKVEDDDEAMNAAVQKGKETFPQFEKNWKRKGIDGFSIKLGLKTVEDSLEHIWFTPIKIEGDQITATCANDPEHIAGLKFGDRLTVDRSAVSDWMILTDGKCYGGYTIRVLAEREPAAAPPFEFADFPDDAK